MNKASRSINISNAVIDAFAWADASPVPLPTRLVARVGEWLRRARSRRALAALDARLLRDIGITPEDAQREVERPFWR